MPLHYREYEPREVKDVAAAAQHHNLTMVRRMALSSMLTPVSLSRLRNILFFLPFQIDPAGLITFRLIDSAETNVPYFERGILS